MALDHQEQEQVEALKSWWQQHGNLVLLVVSAALIAIAAWRGWTGISAASPCRRA